MFKDGNLHVVFGTGPAGSMLARVLHAQGKQVRCVNRSGDARVPQGVSVVAGDILDVAQVRVLTADAAVVYHCANVPYPQQVELIPRFGASIIDGAARGCPARGSRYALRVRCNPWRADDRGDAVCADHPQGAHARHARRDLPRGAPGGHRCGNDRSFRRFLRP